MEIIRTNPGEATFRLFESVPHSVYPDGLEGPFHGQEVCEEFLSQCYVVMDKAKPLARAAVYENPDLFHEGEATAALGNFECVRKQEVSGRLLEAAFEDIRKRGIKKVVGPMDGSTWNNYRFKTTDENPPFFLEPDHPVYYNELFLKSGFSELSSYASYRIHPIEDVRKEVRLQDEEYARQGFHIRPINPEDYESELRKVYELSCEVFAPNLFYTPFSWESFIERYRPLEPFARPEHTLILENSEGESIGFIFCIDDYLSSSEKRIIVKTWALKPAYRKTGLGVHLFNRVRSYALENGYEAILGVLMILTNQLEAYFSENSHLYRTYKLYLKEL